MNKMIQKQIVAVIAGFFLLAGNAWAEDGQNENKNESGLNAPAVANALLGDQKELTSLDQKVAETKESLKKEAESALQVRKEAEKVIEEKQILEKQVQIKEKEAQIAEQELAVAKEEALLSGDDSDDQKTKELAKKAQVLSAEATIEKNKLAIAEEKAQLAQESFEKSNSMIAALNKEIEDLRKEKSMKQGWLPKLSLAGGFTAAGLLFLFLLNWAVGKFEDAISEKDAIREGENTLRLKTLSALFRWVGSIVIFGFVIFMILDNLGVDMAPVLAGAGILGLALGFGGQYLIRDIINGIFILVEGQYRINDIVKIGEHGGLVEKVNLRYTRLRDIEGRVVYIPNGKVETVINLTQEFAQAVLEIGVAYKENVDQVMAVLIDIGKEMRNDKYFGMLILDDLEMLGVDDFAESQVTIKCRMKTLPTKQWEVAREFRRRVKNKFDELDIEIPFPHLTIFQGKDKAMDKLMSWQEENKKKSTSDYKRGYAGDTGD